MYKTILVPIDLSHPELGKKTLGIAREIGGKQARIVALYVAADIPAYAVAELPDGLPQKYRKRSLTELNWLADEYGAQSEVLSGHLPTTILEYAKQIEADLIVIASHRPGLMDYFLGSTAARVVRYAECAVLVDR